MRQFFEEYNMVFAIAAVGCLTIGMKSIAAIIYFGLIREAEQMGSTKNKKMKSFIAKFEAVYKLKMEIHNVECRVKNFMYNLHVLGTSLNGWKNIGLYGGIISTLMFGVDIVAGLNYEMSGRWFIVNALTYAATVLLIASSELVLQNRRKHKQLYVQMLDYAENTLKSHLEKEYLRSEETMAYQREYFEPELNEDNYGHNVEEEAVKKKNVEKENESVSDKYENEEQEEAASTLEHLKLLEEFIEQL